MQLAGRLAASAVERDRVGGGNECRRMRPAGKDTASNIIHTSNEDDQTGNDL
ncbi:hypothetical protein ACFPN5_03035 [Massilia niabensis]|uniref:Uncharacterized protein n=1 Tax=Massilia niabensis TaxID=544910 RepID=A0ABW0L020_9BURK